MASLLNAAYKAIGDYIKQEKRGKQLESIREDSSKKEEAFTILTKKFTSFEEEQKKQGEAMQKQGEAMQKQGEAIKRINDIQMLTNDIQMLTVDTDLRELILNKIKEVIRDFGGKISLKEVASKVEAWFKKANGREDSRKEKISILASIILQKEGAILEKEKVTEYIVSLINKLVESEQAKEELERERKRTEEIERIKKGVEEAKKESRKAIEVVEDILNRIDPRICIDFAITQIDQFVGKLFKEKADKLRSKGENITLEYISKLTDGIFKVYGFTKEKLLEKSKDPSIKRLIFFKKTANGEYHAFTAEEINEKGIVVYKEGNLNDRASIKDRTISWDDLVQEDGEVIVSRKAEDEYLGGRELSEDEVKIASKGNNIKADGTNNGGGSTGGAQGAGTGAAAAGEGTGPSGKGTGPRSGKGGNGPEKGGKGFNKGPAPILSDRNNTSWLFGGNNYKNIANSSIIGTASGLAPPYLTSSPISILNSAKILITIVTSLLIFNVNAQAASVKSDTSLNPAVSQVHVTGDPINEPTGLVTYPDRNTIIYVSRTGSVPSMVVNRNTQIGMPERIKETTDKDTQRIGFKTVASLEDYMRDTLIKKQAPDEKLAQRAAEIKAQEEAAAQKLRELAAQQAAERAAQLAKEAATRKAALDAQKKAEDTKKRAQAEKAAQDAKDAAAAKADILNTLVNSIIWISVVLLVVGVGLGAYLLTRRYGGRQNVEKREELKRKAQENADRKAAEKAAKKAQLKKAADQKAQERIDRLAKQKADRNAASELRKKERLEKKAASKAKATKAQESVKTINNYLTQANALMRENRYAEAIENYAEAIKLDSDSSYIWHQLGYAEDARGNTEAAIEAYNKAIEKIKPGDKNVYVTYDNLGDIYANIENYDLAATNFRKALEFAPKEKKEEINARIVYLKTTGIDKDEKKTDGKDPEANAGIQANEVVAENQETRVLKAGNRKLSIDALIALGDGYFAVGKYNEALGAYEKAENSISDKTVEVNEKAKGVDVSETDKVTLFNQRPELTNKLAEIHLKASKCHDELKKESSLKYSLLTTGSNGSSPISELPVSANIPVEKTVTVTSSPVNKLVTTSFLSVLRNIIEKGHSYFRSEATAVNSQPQETGVGIINLSLAPPKAYIAASVWNSLSINSHGNTNGGGQNGEHKVQGRSEKAGNRVSYKRTYGASSKGDPDKLGRQRDFGTEASSISLLEAKFRQIPGNYSELYSGRAPPYAASKVNSYNSAVVVIRLITSLSRISNTNNPINLTWLLTLSVAGWLVANVVNGGAGALLQGLTPLVAAITTILKGGVPCVKTMGTLDSLTSSSTTVTVPSSLLLASMVMARQPTFWLTERLSSNQVTSGSSLIRLLPKSSESASTPSKAASPLTGQVSSPLNNEELPVPSSSPIADVFALGLTLQGIFFTAVFISAAFASTYMLARKNMHYAATAVLLYLVNVPLNFAKLGAFFQNWFYNFLDVAFYTSAALLIVEVIRFAKVNFTETYSPITKPIKPVHYKQANRTMVAVWLALLLQEIMSKYDFTRSLIEAVYWRKLTYDPYDMVAYTVGFITFFIITNKLFRGKETRYTRGGYLINNHNLNKNSRKGSSSSPVGAAVTTVLSWLILRSQQTSGIVNDRELALYANISLDEVEGLVNQINYSRKVELISEGLGNWRIKVLSASSPVYRVLVVDDEEPQRDLLRMIFERAGYQVEEAINGEEALKKIQNKKFDLMTTDNRMGNGMLGTKLIEETLKLNLALAIIFISATEEITESGLVRNLSKPYLIDDLANLAAGLLELSRSSSPILKALFRSIFSKSEEVLYHKTSLAAVVSALARSGQFGPTDDEIGLGAVVFMSRHPLGSTVSGKSFNNRVRMGDLKHLRLGIENEAVKLDISKEMLNRAVELRFSKAALEGRYKDFGYITVTGVELNDLSIQSKKYVLRLIPGLTLRDYPWLDQKWFETEISSSSITEKDIFIQDLRIALAGHFNVGEGEVLIPADSVEFKYSSDTTESRVVSRVFVNKKPYFVKTARYGEQEVQGSNALKALLLPNPNTQFVLGFSYNYYLYEWIGNINLLEIPIEYLRHKNFRYSYACELGKAAAAAFIIGLADRSPTNHVASFAYGDTISAVINIDLTPSFAYLGREPKEEVTIETPEGKASYQVLSIK